ncbi:MAG: radical SAM protein [Phycisphaeraceae bacterium]
MMTTLMVNEIFYSIQGESTWAGLPCMFVRLTGCHLRCHYCDTEYAFHEGRRWTIDEIVAEVERISHGYELVEITGGEPLLQPGVHPLMSRLCEAGKTVLLETSGACDISPCDPRVIRIMDLKTPDSGEASRNLWSNIAQLNARDEVKFVLCSRRDYEWMRAVLQEHDIAGRVKAVLVGAAAEMPAGRELQGTPGLSLRELAEWVLADRASGGLPPVRMQTQLHKLIWDPMTRGV